MKLHYQISGDGPPLIILHGLFGTLENWGSQVTALSQHYTVISVDLRNHGRSPHCDAMNYTLMAADVIELMDLLSFNSSAIIGHSMGGKVAMQIALNYPHAVTQLIVVDIAPVNYSAHHEEIFNGLFSIELASLNSRAAADKQLKAYTADPGIRAFLLKNLFRNQDKTFSWRFNLPALRQSYHLLSLAPSGTTFDGDTLFIKGKNSDYILRQHQSPITTLFSKATFKIIEGAGHWPHAEKPKVFSSIIMKFLANRNAD
ncbi:MAG: alpha/beta superfamily hydrolase [Osedax symbiont Rs2]|nr:MAG: alpha/beta superfamily hydrolase [Osedax symbiont Rs2]